MVLFIELNLGAFGCPQPHGRDLTAVTSRVATESRSRAGTLWEGTVEEAPVAFLNDSRRS